VPRSTCPREVVRRGAHGDAAKPALASAPRHRPGARHARAGRPRAHRPQEAFLRRHGRGGHGPAVPSVPVGRVGAPAEVSSRAVCRNPGAGARTAVLEEPRAPARGRRRRVRRVPRGAGAGRLAPLVQEGRGGDPSGVRKCEQELRARARPKRPGDTLETDARGGRCRLRDSNALGMGGRPGEMGLGLPRHYRARGADGVTGDVCPGAEPAREDRGSAGFVGGERGRGRLGRGSNAARRGANRGKREAKTVLVSPTGPA